MFSEDYSAVANIARRKVDFLTSNPLGYFIAAVLAGVFVGVGTLLAFNVGGMSPDFPYVKLLMGAVFGIALSLVITAGAELFTGNNMVMAIGLSTKTVSVGAVIKLWGICMLGNWTGSALLALMYYGTGLVNGQIGEFMLDMSAIKMNLPPGQLFLRAVLCNMLVCLGAWCGYRLKSETAKLIMVFWCLLAFVAVGFEHSVANMTLLTVALLSFENLQINAVYDMINVNGYFYNILVSAFGNMTGGVALVALPYYLMTKK